MVEIGNIFPDSVKEGVALHEIWNSANLAQLNDEFIINSVIAYV